MISVIRRHSVLALIALVCVFAVRDILTEHRRLAELRIAEQEREDAALARVAPVVTGMQPYAWELDAEGMSASVAGDKVRDCVFRGVVFTNLETGHDGSVHFVDDLTPDSTRPKGKQPFGRWHFSAVKPGERLTAQAKHECEHGGDRFTVTTEIGTWDAGQQR